VHFGERQKQTGELLAAGNDAEFRRLLIELVVSSPALARPMIFAFELCACSRNEEKSDEFKGMRTEPSTWPPLDFTRSPVSFQARAERVVGGHEKPGVTAASTSAPPVPTASAWVS